MLLALFLVAAVPVALFAALVMMLLGHVVGGLALFGGSVLAAIAGVWIAGLSGMRHLRKMLSRDGMRIVRLNADRYTDVGEPAASDYHNLVQLDRSEYTDVR
ncbi:MAG: hypothetical protein ACYCO9_13965 [Streptosporangiaceae bacterium]